MDSSVIFLLLFQTLSSFGLQDIRLNVSLPTHHGGQASSSISEHLCYKTRHFWYRNMLKVDEVQMKKRGKVTAELQCGAAGYVSGTHKVMNPTGTSWLL